MADPTSPDEWEELARKIASSEIEDPVEAAETEKAEKAIRKRIRIARLAAFLAGLLVLLLGSGIIGMFVFFVTEIFAEENVIENGFGWWNSFLIGFLVLVAFPGARAALNYRNDT